jgi:copper chaperone
MLEFNVEGMSCQHCVKAVTNAVHEIDPAAGVAIDLPQGKVSIDSAKEASALKEAITQAGYTVTSPA